MPLLFLGGCMRLNNNLTISKILNNNCISAVDENNNKYVVMHKGIGYHNKKDDILVKDIEVDEIYIKI